MKIMVVDDSRHIRRHVSKLLEKLGHATCVAEDGVDCLEKLKAEPVDLVLMDWNMPNKDGFEALVEIRADQSLASVQVVMMTTENDSEKIQKALNAGAVEYIMKPFTPEIVEEKLQSLDEDFI